MVKVLCVAEKNSIAKNVAQILSGGRSTMRPSTSPYIKNYDFQYDFQWLNMGRCNVTMTAVAGHLMNLAFPQREFGWGKCDPNALFDAPTIDEIDDKIVKNLQNEGRHATHLMIWTDCDREGECIGWEIVQAVGRSNPRLVSQGQGQGYGQSSAIYRAVFSHLDPSHIIYAANNPRSLDQRQVDAVRARQEIDLRAGLAFTRLLTGSYRSLLQSDHEYIQLAKKSDKPIISYGTCQFPTLGFVVDRYERVVNFVPEQFWHITLSVKDTDGSDSKVKFQWERGHLFDRLAVLTIYESCIEKSEDKAKVIHVSSRETKKYRPLLLTTVELQKNCSRFFKLSAKKTLDAAEKLYQQGFISYPRTETDKFPTKTDLKSLLAKHKDHSEWGSYVENLLDENSQSTNKFQWPRAGSHDDQAHPPIHPILCVDISRSDNRMSSDEKTVYNYVVKHFLACCSTDARGRSTTLRLNWGDETFYANGIQVFERNFLDIYQWADWKSNDTLPAFQMNDQVIVSKTEMKSGQTSPPKHMTESELIMLMDANGIGTDATIADHIEKIKSRNYIKVQAGSGSGAKKSNAVFIPTSLGRSLVHGFEKIGLEESFSKPFLRRDLEQDLQRICGGSKEKKEVVSMIIEMYRNYYQITTNQMGNLIKVYNDIKAESQANVAQRNRAS
ncbi:DNA topoisomerase [Kluyveromyces marxianus]|nr:DNA topoisomerase [Kluyveromyces marxianus]KAG0683589.1 DNA topoisomerase [Kluyveromyces marxianus]